MLTPVPQNITVFGDKWALNQSNCCSKKRKFGHTDTRNACVQKTM